MPSGSSSGGGHGGGGSFSGGGGHGSGGSSGSFHRPIRPIYIHVGRTRYVVSTTKQSVLGVIVILLIMGILGLIGGCFVRSQTVKDIQTYETDYIYYTAMAQNALDNPEYLTTGYITGKLVDTDSHKWQLTYKFQTTDGTEEWVEGYTFFIYSVNQINAFEIDEEIALAVNSKIITTKTDCINMDYLNTTLEDDGQYVYAVKLLSPLKIVIIVAGVLTGSLVLTIVIMLFSTKAKVAEPVKEETPTTPEEKPTQTNTYCAYCGSLLKEGEHKCPNCGSKQNL